MSYTLSDKTIDPNRLPKNASILKFSNCSFPIDKKILLPQTVKNLQLYNCKFLSFPFVLLDFGV
jgi:hypothetical protein